MLVFLVRSSPLLVTCITMHGSRRWPGAEIEPVDIQVGLPYVRARLQDYYERLGGGPDREELNEELVVPRTLVRPPLNFSHLIYHCKAFSHTSLTLCTSFPSGGTLEPTEADGKAQRTFKAVYPYANLALDSVLLGYDIAYMFEKTRYYRPWLAWMGLRVVRDDGEAEGILGGANGGGSVRHQLPCQHPRRWDPSLSAADPE